MMTSAALLGIDSCPMEGFDLDKVTEILARKCCRYGTFRTISYGCIWLSKRRTKR